MSNNNEETTGNNSFTPVDQDAPEININEVSEDLPNTKVVHTEEEALEETNNETTNATEEVPLVRTNNAHTEVTELYMDDNPHAAKEKIDLPPLTVNKLKDILGSLDRADIADSEENRKWFEVLQNSLDKETFKQVYEKVFTDPNRDFKQSISFNGKKLKGSRPRVKETDNQILKGNRAIVSLMSYLGRGIHFQVPLWNTGIWVTFVSPGDTEILELYRQLIHDKIEMGRYSYGLILSNAVSYTVDRLVDFALSYVHSTTLKLTEEDNTTLKDIIVSQDIPSLLWGLACAIYPNGFNFSRACINDADKCNFVKEGVLRVQELQWADNNLLTDNQKAHMSDRQANCKNLESINRYKEDHSKFINKTVSIKSDTGKDIKFTLTSPSISSYIESGYRWIQSMVDLVENSIVVPENDEERNKYINENSRATTIRQYAHWVKEIEFNNTISDKETIEATLNYLSSDAEISNSFIKEVISYIENSSVAVIGIPNYTCPMCDKLQYETELKVPFYKEIIPLDPIVLFTDLIVERTQLIAKR